MHLSWDQQDGIAKALLMAYPDEDRLALGHEDLRRLIVALPGFQDDPHPPGEAWLQKILWTWMRLAHEALDAAYAPDEDIEVSSSPCSAPRILPVTDTDEGRGG